MPWETTLSNRVAVHAQDAVALLYCRAMTNEITPDDGALLPKVMLISWRAKGLGTLRKALHDVRTAFWARRAVRHAAVRRRWAAGGGDRTC